MNIRIEDETCVKAITLLAALAVVFYPLLGVYALFKMAGWFTGFVVTGVSAWCIYAAYNWEKNGYYIISENFPDDEEV